VRLVDIDREDEETTRVILPLALAYHQESSVVAAWCELRQGFRHFRGDRVVSWTPLRERFRGERARLTRAWPKEQEQGRAPAALAWTPDTG
jgi:predicted DNA-binding transcriptional regulator YafY